MFMKKFLGVLVALTLCFCLFAPAAMAADSSTDILAQLQDLDPEVIKNLTVDDIASMFGISTDTADDVMQNLGVEAAPAVTDAVNVNNAEGGSVLDSLSGLLGGVDLSGITAALSGDSDALSSITEMFSSMDTTGGFDLTALTDIISGAFAGEGMDLSALTAGLDVGSFDIASILGGLGSIGGGSDAGEGDMATGTTDMMAGLMDTLTGGLASLGLDTSMIEGLLDNDIVNFFANLYIGLGEVVGGEETTAPVMPTDQTTKPAVVTTETPKTGDTSAVMVALGTISVAAAAAFVCLKKKEN